MTPAELTVRFATPERRAALKKLLAAKSRRAEMRGLAGSAPAMALASLALLDKGAPAGPVLVVGDNPDDAGYLYHDLTRIMGEEAVAMFPSGYNRDIKYGRPDAPARILRTETLSRMASLRFIVTSPEALAEQVARPDAMADDTLRLTAGGEADMTEVTAWLRTKGFREVDYVYEPGQFAVRGSILDIFGFSHEAPYRLDFFGDEIDSMRQFSVETQLSEERFEKGRQIAIAAGALADASGAGGVSLLEFMPEDTVVAVRSDDYALSRVQAICAQKMSDSAMIAGDADDDSDFDPQAMSRTVNPDTFATSWAAARKLRFTAAGEEAGAPEKGLVSYNFGCTPQALYHKNFELISGSFKGFISEGYDIFILSDSPKQQERLRAIFDDRDEAFIQFTPVDGTLHEGFVDPATHSCFFTDHQIFDRFHKYTLRSDKARSGKLALSLKELAAIEPGDYIVHVDHGVGRFAGLLRTDINGRPQEMIKLVYANDDIIFVSIHALHKLAKYRGREGEAPKLNKLGSGAWNKLKEKTKDRLKDIARDLIRLYAARREQQGFAFGADTFMQHELEAGFAYEDTPDQLKATRDVKADMEAPVPMDRLVCGDVGFGKTEIAVRAAFKAAADNKQTAVLVPTTVLAYQHYHTFKRRLADFPVRVEYLSRARSAADTKKILADLAAGKIDIVIGTHKLVGKSVAFKNLGLLVIDEEQKFGVAVKEKLRQMKTNVDTLTMSATPIPRTLQFSLMGARDFSVISTPPPNRRPIVTTVATLNDDLIKEAVEFELSRNGQVFIVNNRIEGLDELEARVRRLVPDARIVTGHGRMTPEKLEAAIAGFQAHDYDVLIATTIIESGVDMPNVNTMLVNNAHNFGLSELHQLRGRVGRSARKAFCYLLVPPGKPLTPVARRRLQAIESFSDLGSGIHIAMQDLDIRGAGNLLGAEQSGFIADLGYETYQKILREAVTELRTGELADLMHAPDGDDNGEGFDYVQDCVIESDLELRLPPTYVPRDSERVSLYQELDSIDDEAGLQAFADRLRDRFGAIPDVTEELLRVPRLRRLARRLGIEKVALKQGRMFIYFVDDTNRAYYQGPMFGKLLNYLQQNANRVRIRERDGRRSFVIESVWRVETAVDILRTVFTLPSL